MGIRIHEAIGYGMTAEDFEKLCLLKSEDENPYELVYEKLSQTKELVSPNYFRDWYDPDILKTEDKVSNRATDLFTTIGIDDTTAVIFFPNLYFASQWYRYDDHIDYYRNLILNNEDDGICDEIHWSNRHPYPFSGYTDESGNILKDSELFRTKNRIPIVPDMMVWYLTELGIFDEAGAKKLRPVYAKWWS